VRKNAEQKKQKCKNCEGKGTLKKGDKIVRLACCRDWDQGWLNDFYDNRYLPQKAG
jgi:hypothetical protein